MNAVVKSARQAVTVADVELAERCKRGRVVLVDDEREVRDAFGQLLYQEGYAVELYASAAACLEALAEPSPHFPGPWCVVCDVRMPGLDGLAMQGRLEALGEPPILLMSGSSGPGDVVAGFRAGALDFLLKPIHPDELLDAVARALAESGKRQGAVADSVSREQRLALLTPREREVIRLVARGLLNRVVAAQLGIGVRTVKLHRQHAMAKLGVQSVAELALFAAEAGL